MMMTRLFTALGRFGLWLASVVALLGGRRGGAPSVQPRRLFDTIPGPEGRERTLFHTVDWEEACAEPTPAPAPLAAEGKAAKPRRGRRRRLVVTLTLPVVALVAGLTAFAYFTSSGTGSGNAATGTLAATTIDTATATGVYVDLDWSAVTAPGGGSVDGYYVLRDGLPTGVAGCGNSASPTTNTSCTDVAPGAATYSYTVVTKWRSWTSTSAAAPVTVIPDVTLPTSSIVFPGSGPYNASSWNSGCGSAICGSASDVGSGVNKVEVSIQQGAGNYWNGSGFSSASPVWNLASGTTSWTYAFLAANLPADGSYTVQSRATDNFTNAQLPVASQTFSYDATAPTNALSLTAQSPSGSSYKDGSTVYYRGTGGGSGGSFGIRNAVADSGSGPASSTTAALGGTTSGWTHAPSTVSTPAGGPYDAAAFTWAEGTSSSPTEVVTGADVAGNTTAAGALTFVDDSAGPTGGVLTVNGQGATGGGTSGYSASTGFAIDTRTDYSADAASGFASSVLEVQSFALSSSDGIAGGICGLASAPFSSPTAVTGTTQPGGIVTGRCYTYTLTGTDNVGNTSTISTTVKVDTSAPSAPAITLSAATGNTFISGTTVFINAQAGRSGSFSVSATTTDADSGILNVIFPSLTDFTAGGGTDTGSPYSSGTYTWSDAVGATGSQTVTATNNASGTANSSFTVTPDTTNPTGGSITANGSGSDSYNTTGTIAISKTLFGDGVGSGIASNIVTRASATLTGNVCTGGFSGADVVAGATDPGLATGCYQYTLTGTDNVGNTATALSAIVKVDTTAPSVPNLGFSGLSSSAFYNGSGTLFIRPAAGGTFTVTAASTDADTGVSSYTFGSLNTNGGTNFGGSQVGDQFNYTFGATTTAPTTPRTVLSTNDAGANSANATYSITADTTAGAPANSFPTATTYTMAAWAASGGGCSTSTICGTATDGAGSGVNKVELSIRQGSGNYWNGSSFSSASPVFNLATGTTAWSLPFAGSNFPASGSYTIATRMTDNVGNISTSTSVTFTIDAPPILQTLEMFDTNTDGKVDQVKATFNETLATPYSAGTAPWTLANVPSGGTLSTVTVAGAVATLNITPGAGAADTSVGSFTVALAASATGIRDAAGNQSSFAATAPVDKAGPVPITVTSVNNGATVGKMESTDTFVVAFSESIANSSGATTITETDPSGTGNDTLTIAGLTNGARDTGSNGYIAGNNRSAAIAGTLGVSGATITVTVGSGACTGAGCGADLTAGGPGALVFAPSSTIVDAAGNSAAGTMTTAATFRIF